MRLKTSESVCELLRVQNGQCMFKCKAENQMFFFGTQSMSSLCPQRVFLSWQSTSDNFGATSDCCCCGAKNQFFFCAAKRQKTCVESTF